MGPLIILLGLVVWYTIKLMKRVEFKRILAEGRTTTYYFRQRTEQEITLAAWRACSVGTNSARLEKMERRVLGTSVNPVYPSLSSSLSPMIKNNVPSKIIMSCGL